MSSPSIHADAPAFDAVAGHYEQELNEGLRLSGESPEYFAARRVDWTARSLAGESIRRVLDFGCGVGLAAPLLAAHFQPSTLWGFDPAAAAIQRARRDHPGAPFQFTTDSDTLPAGEFDLTYCNGVFHHIPLIERARALATIERTLRPGGWLALWENNPWNPGTRWVMSRIPFDRDAVVLSPPECRRMLRSAGFEILRTDAWFLFPRALGWLRPLETLVHRLPLGGQYLVLARKPLRARPS